MLNNVFEKKEMQPVGFFEKTFKLLSSNNSIIELNNILSESNSINDVTFEIVDNISKKYKVNISKKFKNELKELYRKYVVYCLTDNKLSDKELNDLKHLQEIFGLTIIETSEIQKNEVEIIYKQNVNNILSDGRLTKEEQKFLNELETNLKLAKEASQIIFDDSRKEYYLNYLSNSMADERLSPEEEKELREISKSLNLEVNIDQNTQELLNKYRLFWQIENGAIPVISAPIILQKSENCYFHTNMNWYEYRTITKRINYAGPTFRMKIAKGLYWRVGSLSAERVTEDVLKHIDSGDLYLTNKRIIFMGNRKNTTISLSKILDFNVYNNGVELQKDSGKSPFFEFSDNIDLFTLILGRCIRDLS